MALSTFTVIVHVFFGNAELLKLIVPDAAVAVTVPPQVFVTPGVVATTKPDGRPSEKLPVIGTTLPFVMLKVSVDAVFSATVVGLKLVVIDGGCKIMIPALAVPPLDAARPGELSV